MRYQLVQFVTYNDILVSMTNYNLLAIVASLKAIFILVIVQNYSLYEEFQKWVPFS